MAKYVFPAVFTKEDIGGYSISFPDIDGCFTQGEDMWDGLIMANDVLCLMLYHMEKKGEMIPLPTDPLDIEHDENSFVSLIGCDTLVYKKFYDNAAVRDGLFKTMYPAVFMPEDNGEYSVYFPDLKGCLTCGNDIGHAMGMAQEALGLYLVALEEDEIIIPTASDIREVRVEEGCFVVPVMVEVSQYRRDISVGALA